jgi:hypothetical protein
MLKKKARLARLFTPYHFGVLGLSASMQGSKTLAAASKDYCHSTNRNPHLLSPKLWFCLVGGKFRLTPASENASMSSGLTRKVEGEANVSNTDALDAWHFPAIF